jgi:hypothetical protein
VAERVTAMGCTIAHSAERAFAGMSDHILTEIAMPQFVTTQPASGSVVVPEERSGPKHQIAISRSPSQ